MSKVSTLKQSRANNANIFKGKRRAWGKMTSAPQNSIRAAQKAVTGDARAEKRRTEMDRLRAQGVKV